MSQLSGLVSRNGKRSVAHREKRAATILGYFQTIEVGNLALRSRKEEVHVHRMLLACENPMELCALVTAVVKLRSVILEICKMPKRPTAESAKQPRLVLDSESEPTILPPQDTKT